MMHDYFDTYASDYKGFKRGSWCYEDGCVYRGLECLYRATGEARWFEHVKRLVDLQIEEGPALAGYCASEYNIDNILSGRALLFLHEVTDDPRYLDTAGLLAAQLANQPRTKSGVYWHKLRYPWQVWLDGVYMCAPFQIDYGRRTGRQDLIDDSLAQLQTILRICHSPVSGLYVHAVDETRTERWSDPDTGQSSAHWGRALGWFAMALVDVAELVGSDVFSPLETKTANLLTNIAALQQPDGLWLQVVDQPELDNNYQESSASAMFVYALLSAAERGLWSGSTSGLYNNLVAETIRSTTNNQYEMINICAVAGLGLDKDNYRDGSAQYYLSEARVSNEPKGVGSLMMCAAKTLQTKARSADYAQLTI